MRRRDLISTALLAAAASPVLASAPPKKTAVGQYVDLAPTALPVVAGGKLRNYVFVSLRINLTGRADPTKFREKEPYFRDALVRAGHRRPFTVPGDWMQIDQATLKTVMLREAEAITGPGIVASVILNGAPTAQHRVRTPQP